VRVASVGAVNRRGNTMKMGTARPRNTSPSLRTRASMYGHAQSTPTRAVCSVRADTSQRRVRTLSHHLYFSCLLGVSFNTATCLDAHQLQLDRFDWRFALNHRQPAQREQQRQHRRIPHTRVSSSVTGLLTAVLHRKWSDLMSQQS
jgi:hypothetical protein